MTGSRSGSDVTVVVTTYNRPGLLAECLASIRRQTLKGFKVVVLDNASTADYAGVVEAFAGLPITYVRNETNIGSVANVARAMRDFSTSEYVVVFHDDDLMHPRMLEAELGVMEAEPALEFVATELAAFDEKGAPAPGTIEGDLPLETYADQSALARSLLRDGGLCFPSTMYRSSVLREIRPDAKRFGIVCDRPLLLDAARLGPCALIRAPLVSYRHHPGQDTRTGALTARHLIELMRRYREALPARWSGEDRELFYSHARYWLVDYGYSRRLTPEHRIGAFKFVALCLRHNVLRFRDVRRGVLEDLMRVDGRRRLPAAIGAVRSLKQRVAR